MFKISKHSFPKTHSRIMDNEWWITGLEESKDESISKDSFLPIRNNVGITPSGYENSVIVQEDFFSIDKHFNRIRNIFLAPIFILFLSTAFPLAGLLLIPYPIYIFYSFLVSMDLRGRHLASGFFIGNLLLLPSSFFLGQGNDNFIIGLFIPLAYIFYLPYAIGSTSLAHKKASIGMFYGIISGVVILYPIAFMVFWLLN